MQITVKGEHVLRGLHLMQPGYDLLMFVQVMGCLLYTSGKGRAFADGVLSGIVEPIGAVLTILAARMIVPALPYLLSFAAGAMLYVVVEELIPEMSQGRHCLLYTSHVMVHHNGERISAEGQCEAASADIRRKQAGNAQIKRNGQRAAGVYAECVADEIGAIRKQIRCV